MTDRTPIASRESMALLIEAANANDAEWRLEGSGDWLKKPGRLTVWMDYGEDAFDLVHDALNPPEVAA